MEPNILIIKIQPTEGVYLQFNIKRPGDSEDIIPAKMDFCQNCSLIHQLNTLRPMNVLSLPVWQVNAPGSHQWDQIEFSWNYISHLKELHSAKRLPVYPQARNPWTG